MIQEIRRQVRKRPMKKNKKIFIFFLIMTVGLLLNRKFQWSSYFKDSNNLKEIMEFVNKNYSLSVLYYLIFTVVGSSVLALPGVTFAVIASGLFGPWKGSFYCLLGTTIGALLSFLLSRYLIRDSIEDLLKKNPKLYNLIYGMDSNKEFLILMITRLLPIFPFNLQNFAYGISKMSPLKYSIGTFLFMIPGTVIFSLGTEGLINKESRSLMFIISLFIVLLMVLVGSYLYKKYTMLIVEEQNER